MARKLYEKQAIRRRTGALANGVVLKVYTDEAGTVLADISDTVGGSAIAGSQVTTADIPGLGPAALRFWGPTDGTDTLYMRVPSDTSLGVQKIEADTDPRLDALEAGGGGGGGIAATIFDAKGDLIGASAADTAARLAVGAADSKLTPDSTQTTGLRWQVNEGPRNPMSAVYGAAGDGTTDDTAAFTTLINSFGTRGGEIELPPRVFLIPGGITESVPGLVVRGLGQRHINTGTTASTTGAQIKSTTTGAWCWTHENPNASGNDYKGPRFEAITFLGDADTGGGLRIYSASAAVIQCCATGHLTGTGFLSTVDPTATGADDVSWALWEGNVALNNLVGIDTVGGVELIGCWTLKTTASGIKWTGTGIRIRGGNCTVLGGKTEGEGDGWLIDATEGVLMFGAKAENNTRGFYLNRASNPGFSSRIRLVGCHALSTNTTSFELGANQANDMLIGCYMVSDPVDAGSATVILGDASGDLNIRKTGAGQKAISLGVTTETGALVPQTGGVDLDTSMATNSKIHMKLSTSDTSSYFAVRDDADVILFRVYGSSQVSVRRPSDTADRINLEPVGRAINFGSGTAATDTNLYRSAANVLATDDKLQAALGLGMLPQTAPSAPASGAVLYLDTADSKLKAIKAGGDIIVLG